MNAVQPELTGKFTASTSMGEECLRSAGQASSFRNQKKKSKLTLKQAEGRVQAQATLSHNPGRNTEKRSGHFYFKGPKYKIA